MRVANNQEAVIIVAVCVFVLLVSFMKANARAAWVFHFVLRAVLGLAAIYLINSFLREKGIALQVGYNAVSVLTGGTLGFSGVALLYGILFYKML